MKNILTIDVEDYYMVSAFNKIVSFRDWAQYESRVVRNTYKILNILSVYDVKATFFVVAWIGEKFPSLIKDIAKAGHEIASHGYSHSLIYQQTPKEFEYDIRKAKEILENIISEPVIGYRAPSYSITKKSLWALDVLIQSGYKYDSSIFPIHHDFGGLPDAKRFPYKIESRLGELIEVPLSTLEIFKYNLPVAGGGYFRLYPYWVTKKCIQKINAQKNPAIIYLHPWEFDPEQPKIKIKGLKRFRHYVNLYKTESKFKKLLNNFKFQPIVEYIKIKRPEESS